MATPNYTEEEILFRRRARRRLVGAVVLVVTVVAVVPLILPDNKPQQDTQQIEIRIPAQDATGYVPKITPAPAAVPVTPQASSSVAAAPGVAGADAKPAEHAAAIKETPPAEPAAPTPSKAPKSAPVAKPRPSETAKTETPKHEAPKPQSSKPEAAKSEVSKPQEASKSKASSQQSFFVQYGAFSEQKNAAQRQADLKGRGVKTFTEVVNTVAGDKIRVRSGPYGTREEAEQVREKVKPLDSKLVVTGNNP